jgi:hypothetical protein
MNMAVYPLNSRSPEAEYEIAQTVMENGIIKSMILDYGSFKVKANITEVNALR